MNRREVLSRAGMAVASALVPFVSFAEGRSKSYQYVSYHDSLIELEQFERLGMNHDGVTSSGGPVYSTAWLPVVFDDIVRGDLIRRTRRPELGAWWVVDCKRQDEGILEVSPAYTSGPVIVDLLDGNLRVPRLNGG